MERFHERDPNHNPRRKKESPLLWELGPTPRTHREQRQIIQPGRLRPEAVLTEW